jgi:hypothetical protein
MAYLCPVCAFPGLPEPAYSRDGGSLEICFCCGFQFGYTYAALGEAGHKKWRDEWIRNGMKWSNPNPPPDNWDPTEQLKNIPNKS